MIINPLPPQAYTKDTLLKAYNWLIGQNASIKEIATTPDILVSLYLKAQRNGEEALEAPSIQNFKAELKNIANMMGDFSTPTASNAGGAVPPVIPQASPQTSISTETQQTSKVNMQTQTSAQIQTNQVHLDLDSKSLSMIHEVKEVFNLSSDKEALRMLISIGYAKAKNLF